MSGDTRDTILTAAFVAVLIAVAFLTGIVEWNGW